MASVGVSSSPDKPSYGIFAYLLAHGYDMIPVNPGTPEIQGRKTYPDLASIPGQIDVVQVFRKPEDVPPVVEQAIQVGAKVVWMQEGVINEEAARSGRGCRAEGGDESLHARDARAIAWRAPACVECHHRTGASEIAERRDHLCAPLLMPVQSARGLRRAASSVGPGNACGTWPPWAQPRPCSTAGTDC